MKDVLDLFPLQLVGKKEDENLPLADVETLEVTKACFVFARYEPPPAVLEIKQAFGDCKEHAVASDQVPKQ